MAPSAGALRLLEEHASVFQPVLTTGKPTAKQIRIVPPLSASSTQRRRQKDGDQAMTQTD
jgi:hypothetical protein